MRYTEARLSNVAAEMLADLEHDTVDYIDNYDGKYREPLVLPSKFPNLLVNGSDGIAVGMATEIPPHNLREVCVAARPPYRQSRSDSRRVDGRTRWRGRRSRPRFSHRRHHLRPAGHPRRLSHRPGQASRCAPAPTSARKAMFANHHPRSALPGDAAIGCTKPSATWSRTNASRASAMSATNPAPATANRSAWSSTSSATPIRTLVLNQLYQFSPMQKHGQHHPSGPGGRPATNARV